MIIPDVLQQHGARHHLAGMFHEIFQQAELTRLQHDLAAATHHIVRQAVELEIGNPVNGFLGAAAAAARQHLDAGQ